MVKTLAICAGFLAFGVFCYALTSAGFCIHPALGYLAVAFLAWLFLQSLSGSIKNAIKKDAP